VQLRPMAPGPNDQEDMLQAFVEHEGEFYSVATFPFSVLHRTEDAPSVTGGGVLTFLMPDSRLVDEGKIAAIAAPIADAWIGEHPDEVSTRRPQFGQRSTE